MCCMQAQQPRSIITGDLGRWHAQMAAQQQGGAIVIQVTSLLRSVVLHPASDVKHSISHHRTDLEHSLDRLLS